MTINEIIKAVKDERKRQIDKWGSQRDRPLFYWMSVLGEEYGEVCQAALQSDGRWETGATNEDVKEELVQVMAVCAAILEEYFNANR